MENAKTLNSVKELTRHKKQLEKRLNDMYRGMPNCQFHSYFNVDLLSEIENTERQQCLQDIDNRIAERIMLLSEHEKASEEVFREYEIVLKRIRELQ